MVPWEPKFCKIVENPHYMEQTNKQGSRQTNMGAGKRNQSRQTKLGSDKQTWERPRFADLAATAELSLAFEKVAANWGSRQSQAKTTSSEATDHKGQATKEGRMWRR